MKSMYGKVALFILIAGLLTACGAQATEAPTLPPTEEAAPATQAPVEPPVSTDTAAPTEAAPATEPAATTQPPAQAAVVSFTTDILPIIQSRCVNCHGGDRMEKGLDLTSHANLMTGSENGPVVTAGDAADSLLVELVTSQKMPKRGPKLTPPQVQLIADWVNQGALDN